MRLLCAIGTWTMHRCWASKEPPWRSSPGLWSPRYICKTTWMCLFFISVPQYPYLLLFFCDIQPQEPMYLILNTAISHRWGFPEPCPADSCSACWHCFDCTNPGNFFSHAIILFFHSFHQLLFLKLCLCLIECQCALPEGMKGCRNLPAAMRVDYIRLYQDAADPAHSLSCSPASHPTKQFIEGHIGTCVDCCYLLL